MTVKPAHRIFCSGRAVLLAVLWLQSGAFGEAGFYHSRTSCSALPLLAMDPIYENEEFGFLALTGVRYLENEKQLARYEVKFKDGVLVDYRGRPVQSKPALRQRLGKWAYSKMIGEVPPPFSTVVVTADKRMFLGPDGLSGRFHHSSFFAGRPVLLAGLLRVENGVIVDFSNRSGHYKPGPYHTALFLKFLAEQGVKTPRVFYAERHYPAIIEAFEGVLRLPEGPLPPDLVDENFAGYLSSDFARHVMGFAERRDQSGLVEELGRWNARLTALEGMNPAASAKVANAVVQGLVNGYAGEYGSYALVRAKLLPVLDQAGYPPKILDGVLEGLIDPQWLGLRDSLPKLPEQAPDLFAKLKARWPLSVAGFRLRHQRHPGVLRLIDRLDQSFGH